LNCDQIYIYDMASDTYHALTNNTWDSEDPAWSPGGSIIVFTSEESGNRDLYIANLDGTDVMQITFNPADDLRPDWTR